MDKQVFVYKGQEYHFPPGTSQVEMEDYAQRDWQRKQQAQAGLTQPGTQRLPPETPPDQEVDPEAVKTWLEQESQRPGNSLRAFGAGLTFNMADEILAKIRSTLSDRTYDELLKEERDRLKMHRENYPAEAFAQELIGGVVPSLALAPFTGGATLPAMGGRAVGIVAPQTAGRLAGTKALGDQLWKNAGIGLVGGATAEFGAGEGSLENRLAEMPEGALTGFAVGAGVPVALQGLPAFKSKIKSVFGANQRDQALDRVARALGRDKIDVTDLQTIASGDEALGVPTRMLDYGSNLTSLAELMAQKPGAGGAEMADALFARNRGARDRMWGRIRSAISPDDYYAEEGRKAASMSARAQRLYQESFDHGKSLQSQELTELFERPSIKGALPGAIKLMEDKGLKPGVVLDDNGKLVSIDTETAFHIKKALDDAEESARTTAPYSGAQKGTHRSSAIGRAGEEWQAQIRKLNSRYDQAATEFAGDVEVLNAMRMGRHDFLGMHPEEVKKFVNDPQTSDAEKKAFRVGVAQQMWDMIYKLRSNRDVTGPFDSQYMRDRLEPLFDNPGAFKLFIAAVDRDAATKANANRILANSATFRRAATNEDDAGVSLIMPTRQNIMNATLRYLEGKFQRNEKRNNEIAKILMSGSPSEVRAVVAEMQQLTSRRRMALDRRRQARPLTTLGALAPIQETPEEPEEDFAEGGAVRWDGQPEGTLWQRFMSHGR